jgi:hypothetical protein
MKSIEFEDPTHSCYVRTSYCSDDPILQNACYQCHLLFKFERSPRHKPRRPLFPVRYEQHLHIESKIIPVTGSGDLYSCELLWIPLCPESGLIDGDEVVSLTRSPCSAPQKLFISVYGTNFC